MNDLDQKLKDDAATGAVLFSQERHERLLATLNPSSTRSPERPLRSPIELRLSIACATIAVVLIAAMMWLGRSTDSPGLPKDFGAPFRVAERTIVDVQHATSTFPDDPPARLAQDADDVWRFFVAKISLTRSLAAGPSEKSRT